MGTLGYRPGFSVSLGQRCASEMHMREVMRCCMAAECKKIVWQWLLQYGTCCVAGNDNNVLKARASHARVKVRTQVQIQHEKSHVVSEQPLIRLALVISQMIMRRL